MSTRSKAFIAIIIVSFFWATNGIVGKSLLIHFDPLFVAVVRSCIASLFMLPIFLTQKRYPLKEILTIMIPITCLSAINIGLYYTGLSKTTVNASAVMYAATPLIVAIISTFTIREHISAQKITGIIIGFIGVLLFIVLPGIGKGDIGFGTVYGNLILLLAVIAWSSFIIGSKYLTEIKKYPPLFVTSISIFTSAVLLSLFYILSPHTINTQILFTVPILLKFIYVAFFVTVVTYVLFQWAIHKLSSVTASLTNYLQPIIAFYLSWVFLGEKMSLPFIFGSLLVLLGVFITTGGQVIHHVRKFRALRQNG